MNRRVAVLRSIGIVTVSTYIEYALGLLMSVWIARSLGPSDFGRYAFTVWLCGWLIVCSNHALTTSSTKFIAEADGMGVDFGDCRQIGQGCGPDLRRRGFV